ncbi:MAG: hypothetical protein ACOC8B_01495 [Gemmatimonadota bacterium]
MLAAPGLAQVPAPAAQERPDYFGTRAPIAVGYAANAPHSLVGGVAVAFNRPVRGWGAFIDAKGTIGSPANNANFDGSLTAQEVERDFDFHVEFGRESAWRGVNVGIVRVLTGQFAGYVGVGVAEEETYQEYWDPDLERGDGGFYWVEDSADTGTRVNVQLGGWLHVVDRFLFQFGGELAPRGFTIGVSYVLSDGR